MFRFIYRFVALAWSLTALTGTGSAISYRTVAITGSSAPDGGTFRDFEVPVINSAGQTAFTGSINQVANVEYGLWSELAGSLNMTTKVLNPTPATGGYHVGFFAPPAITDGSLVYMSSIGGVSRSFNALWSTATGVSNLIVRGDGPAPNVSGAVFSIVRDAAVNDAGQFAFEGLLTDGDSNFLNNEGIWVGDHGSVSLRVRGGDVAPGTSGSLFRYPARPLINDLGQIAFDASFTSSTGDWQGEGIWAERNGGLQNIVRTSLPAPGTGGAQFTSSLGRQFSFNNAGDVAFTSNLEGPGVNNSNRDGIWIDQGGSLSLVARSGDLAPGLNGAIFAQYGSTIPFGSTVLNGRGDLVFNARVDGPDVTPVTTDSIWRYHENQLSMIVRGGDNTPDGLDTFIGFDTPVLNNKGQMAFWAVLGERPNEFTRRTGVWSVDKNLKLSLVARQGDLFDVNDDPLATDIRMIAAVDLFNYGATNSGAGGQDGHRSSFNDSGQLVFRLVFTDGTQGVFVANTTIPEPPAILLAATIVFLLHLRTLRHGSH